VWVLAHLPTQYAPNWTPGPPVWFSLGDYRTSAEPGLVAYGANDLIGAAQYMGNFPKRFYSATSMSAGGYQSRTPGYIWTTTGESPAVAIIARAGTALIHTIRHRTLSSSTAAIVTDYNKAGGITHPTILGAFHDVTVHQAFTNGVIYEFRMTQQATPPTVQEISDLAFLIANQ
jgi:hypothetical protein